MLGIATIDRQIGSGMAAVWVTKRLDPLRPDHTNAVVINLAEDPQGLDKVLWLTRTCAVLRTEGSDLDGLDLTGETLKTSDIDDMVSATRDHQQDILDAFTAFKRRPGQANLRLPVFLPCPSASDFVPSVNTPAQRALMAANYVRAAWRGWLKAEEERRSRTAHPRTGKSPWVMPEGLDSPTVAPVPDALIHRFHVQKAG